MESDMHTKAKNRFALAVALVLLGAAQAGNAEMDPQAEAAAREYFTDNGVVAEPRMFSKIMKQKLKIL